MLMVLSSLRLQFYLSLLLLRICQELLTVACPAIKQERLTTKRGLAASIPRGRTNTEGLKITERYRKALPSFCKRVQ